VCDECFYGYKEAFCAIRDSFFDDGCKEENDDDSGVDGIENECFCLCDGYLKDEFKTKECNDKHADAEDKTKDDAF
jgi:hypothetical protein